MSCIYVNTFPLPIITKIILPKILKWKVKGKKGAVITISSVAGWDVMHKGLSIYSATKCFNLRFSEILEKEYKDQIDVHCVLPASVDTNLNKDPSGLFAIDSNSFAKQSLSKVGYESTSNGHWKHCTQVYFSKWGPTWWLICKIDDWHRLKIIKKRIKEGKEI